MSSGCGDVISITDLQTAKKHQLFEAEVITGKQGGVAGGADLDYATNQVTGQIQKTMPAVLRDAGFQPASFDFATGGTLGVNDRDKVVYDSVSKTWYSWGGTLPHVIAAGTNPVGDANWKPQTDPNLRSDLAYVAAFVNSVAELGGMNVPVLYAHVVLNGRYLYKRTTGSADGVNKITSADGAVWGLEQCNGIFASDFCTDTPSLMVAYKAAVAFKCDFVVDKNMTGLMAATDDPVNPGNNAFKSVICCESNSTIRFVKDGALRLANQDRPQSHIIYLANGVSNVTIINPVLEGDRLTNTTIGEHGWGLTILQSSNIRVIGGTYSQMFGDGIYIGMKWGTTNGTVPSDIYIEKPVINKCRRNGISLTSGENILIVNPQISNIGDGDSITGAFPKAGIDIEPEADEATIGFTVPRLLNCEISNPFISSSYTGIELNIFPSNLVADVLISGVTTLTNVTARGISVTRINSGGIGKIKFNRVAFKTSPVDYCFFEMMGNDRLVVEIDELTDETTVAGGDRNIRLAPRAYNASLSRNFGNITVSRCVSAISTFVLLAGTDLSNYFLNINIGREEDPITCSLNYLNGIRPAQMRGFIGGTISLSSFDNSRSYNSTIIVNPSVNDTDVQINTAGDFRKLKIKRQLTASSPTRQVQLSGILFRDAGIDKTLVSSTSFSGSIQIQNREGAYTEVFSTFGSWVFS